MPTQKKTIKPKKKQLSEKKAGGLKKVFFPDGPKTFLQGDTLRFVVGVLVLIVALFMLLSFTSFIFTGWADQAAVESGADFEAANYGGTLGARTAYYFMNDCFGISAYFIPIFLVFLSVKLIGVYTVRLWKCFIHCGILLVWMSVAMGLVQSTLFAQNGTEVGRITFNLGGLHGLHVCKFLIANVGLVVTCAIVIAAAIFYMVYVSNQTVGIVRRIFRPHDVIKGRLENLRITPKDEVIPAASPVSTPEEVVANDAADAEQDDGYTVSLDLSHQVADGKVPELILESTAEQDAAADAGSVTPMPEVKEKVQEKDDRLSEPYNPRLDLEHYRFPTVDLLTKYPDDGHSVDMQEQNANKDRIITVLRNFGVEIASIKATIGPTITLYEITPAPGIKISKIRNLEDDIALSLSARGIRIIAPIPGKGTIGIEVPNRNSRIVSMESIINTKKFKETTYDLPIALGKTITNEVFMVDLAKMPHLLVAGATGQGKSVGLNAIITSLLYKKHPAELKFVMVDPKKVEFSIYAPIEKHFLAMIPEEEDPIITDVTKVVQTLKSLCQLMDHRYDLLKRAKVRNIKEYNAKFKARQLNPENGHEFMPYIVVIIDEFGDLIMTAGKEVELPIARIAQLARAVGMHMVIATQRPTTNIITGTIKTNFPARMAFKVMSRIDSQTILDRTGANQLVGRGDMLFLSVNDPVRVQCAFVDTPEVEKICNFIASQQGYVTPYELPEVMAEGSEGSGSSAGLDDEKLDPMFAEAARLIVVHQQGSTSLIQRKFSIGYNRAGRLMDQLERAGIVGPSRGAKPREVLCADEVVLDNLLSGLKGNKL